MFLINNSYLHLIQVQNINKQILARQTIRMGNSNQNSIKYYTHDGYEISYIFLDLKGKGRFPETPGDSEVNFMLDRCLEDINASNDQIKQIKDFNTKYKYRFVVLHKRKLAEAKKQKELDNLRRKTTEIQQLQIVKTNQQKSKIKDLQGLMKNIQLNETVIKVALMKIDKYIAQKSCHQQFIQIKGLQRILGLLQKAILLNQNSTKTNFSSQIQLLKFLKYFSNRYPKQFFPHLSLLPNYPQTILKTYHPINTQITSYCLDLLTDYLWRVESGEDFIRVMTKWGNQQGIDGLTPFVQTIRTSQSILMVYYNLKWVNQLIAAVIEEDKKQILKDSLAKAKYGYVLQTVKSKLQHMHYKLQNATFISMHQKIFKHVTQKSPNIIQQVVFQQRNTISLLNLQQQLLQAIIQQNIIHQQQIDEPQTDEPIVSYIAESDRKRFNKFILDTLTEIQNYNKLQICLDGMSDMDPNQQKDNNLDHYFARIKQCLLKNNNIQEVENTFKNLQYFQKSHWKRLERFVLQQLGLQSNIYHQIQTLKYQLQQKQNKVKIILKQNVDLRNQLTQLRMKDPTMTERIVGRLNSDNKDFLDKNVDKLNTTLENANFNKIKGDINSLPVPPNKAKSINFPQMPASLSKFLPLSSDLESAMKKQQMKQINNHQKPMRDKPRLNIETIKCLDIKISPNKTSQTNNNTLNPPSMASVNLHPLPPNLVNTILPSPPSLGNTILPPPPSLGSIILPSPPSLGNIILPSPPSLGNTILPSPPSLGNIILPSPPSLSSICLPQPPSLSSLSLPSLEKTILPPPPTLNFGSLPALPQINLLPPSLNQILLPTPPMIGMGLPTLPSIGSNLLPNLPIGSANLVMNLNINNGHAMKVKQKRQPKVQLKNCNFTTLSYDKIIDTVFQQIDDLKYQFNEDQLVSMFAKNIIPPKQKQTKSQIISFQRPKQPIKLLSSDRWRNIEIILTKLKMPPGQLKKCLVDCSGKYTQMSVLQCINKIIPTEQQQQTIRSYDGNDQDLGKPQRFYKQMIEVNQYGARLKSIIFSKIKQQLYYELTSKLQQLQSGFNSLKQNPRLKHVIQVCLALGNYLNGSSMKGGAWGFKLQTIQRLQQIKSTDNMSNAAFYLIKEVWKQYQYPIFDKNQLEMYQYLSKMPLAQVGTEIGELNIYYKFIKKAYQSWDNKHQNDRIGHFCEEMMAELEHKLEQYKDLNQKLKNTYATCAKFYCQDATKPSDQFAKKIFQCILFVSNTQKMYKVIEDKRLKQQTRKAVKTQMTYINPTKLQQQMPATQVANPQSNKKVQKKAPILQTPPVIQKAALAKLPLPPVIKNKEQKIKQIQRMQQQRQKKALEEVMMRRTSKIQAYRMSKMTTGVRKGVEEIDFLKGIK